MTLSPGAKVQPKRWTLISPAGFRGLSQSFSDQCASCMRGQHGPTFGYELGFQTPEFLSIVVSIQVRQSATPLQIVRGKTLRQARIRCLLGGGPPCRAPNISVVTARITVSGTANRDRTY